MCLWYWCAKKLLATSFDIAMKSALSETRCRYGKKMGPRIACLFMEYFNKNYAQYEDSTPILYKKYIDDIVKSASCSEKKLRFINCITNFNPSMKYTHTTSDSSQFP